jgi:hypothetical protein
MLRELRHRAKMMIHNLKKMFSQEFLVFRKFVLLREMITQSPIYCDTLIKIDENDRALKYFEI